jgi:sulfur relay protein TusB/DsrH
MKTLHIINTPQTIAGFAITLSRCNPNDSMIFIQDGCYSLNGSAITSQLKTAQVTAYAIEDDLTARNVQFDVAPDVNVNTINVDQFVDLTVQHHKTISW